MAKCECGFADGSDTDGNGDAGQAAISEGVFPDGCDTVGDGNRGKTFARGERCRPDGNYTVRDVINTGFARWILYDGGFLLIEEDAIRAAEKAVRRIYRECCQLPAKSERVFPDESDAGVDAYAGQFLATFECASPDGSDAVGYDIRTGFTRRIQNDGGFLIVEQDSIRAAERGIRGINRECCQIVTEANSNC